MVATIPTGDSSLDRLDRVLPGVGELDLTGKIILFDLEMTSWPGSAGRFWTGPGEEPEIVQIGAIRLDADDGFQECGCFECIVTPEVNPVLSEYFTNLTGITQDQVAAEGIPFADALAAFREFVDSEADDLLCNGEDVRVLVRNCELAGIPFPFTGNRLVNLKRFFQESLSGRGGTDHMCSSDLPRAFGLEDRYESHTALGDCRALRDVLVHILNDGAPATQSPGEALSSRYEKSNAFLGRALRTVPMASQTFSKSYHQYPHPVAPLFASHGKGGRLWDIDGREYVDLVMGLHAVMLGYGDPDVDQAIREQLKNGVTFSLPHSLETEVAEAIVERVPSAEMVRFCKNGSDATSAAIRLARAHTGRDHVAVGGYHGWHDWTIGTTTRNKGVPGVVSGLSHRFRFNDIDSLYRLFKARPGEFGAVIMEVMNVDEPDPGFLESVVALAKENGALVIFDEIITGFRFARGGAQEVFDVTPDLTTLGKGLANGMPLAALAGRARYMREVEEIFFSGTMGGETLSLAAAKAVLEKLDREPVLETMQARGTALMEGVREIIRRHGVEDILGIGGNPVWSFLLFRDAGPLTAWDIKTLWLQETLARGCIIGAATHNLCYAHTNDDIARVLEVYNAVFPLLRQAVDEGSVAPFLQGCRPMVPIFQVRG